MNKKFIISGMVIILIAIAGIVIFTMQGNTPNNVVVNKNVYCSDGTLTDTMPIQSHRSYCLKSSADDKTFSINAQNEYSFSIVDDQGNTLKDFEVTHTKIMHTIVVRKDLANFQHVHPDFDKTTGIFILKDLILPADGTYRIFADFAPMGGVKDAKGMPLPVTLSEDVNVGNLVNYAPQSVGSEERTKTFDGYQVALSADMPLVSGKESMIAFNIIQDKKPVTDLQEYLGALGHSVILREGNLDFIHAHPLEDVKKPQNGKVSFMVNFPEAGKYKIFTQFQRNGKVFTTDFVVSVALGAGNVPSNPMH